MRAQTHSATTPPPTHGKSLPALFQEWRDLTTAHEEAVARYDAAATKPNEVAMDAILDVRDDVEDRIVSRRATTAEELAAKVTILARHEFNFDDLATSLARDAEAFLTKGVN